MLNKKKHSKESLQEVANRSVSLRDMSLNLGYDGMNVRPVKQYIQRFELNVTHFNTYIKPKNPRLSDDEIFVLHSTFTSASSNHPTSNLHGRLKKYKPYHCAICDQLPIWNNKPLRLQVDHIDGNRRNNLLINLRYVCPNCHTQTDTYSNKKRNETTVNDTEKNNN